MLGQFLRIKIYLPADMPTDSSEFPERKIPSTFLDGLISAVRDHNTIGVLGPYRGVYELGPGLEGYTSGTSANPAHGVADRSEQIQNIAFITYARADRSVDVAAFVEQAASLHPWEYPVIEIAEISMWTPDN